MNRQIQRRVLSSLGIPILLLSVSACWGQAPDDSIPLGDLARSLRKEHQSVAMPMVIDNDNLSMVMDEVESRRLAGTSLSFTFDGMGKMFQVSTPDVTCSLSFNAQMASLLSDPYVSRNLPASEMEKLDGPATINGDNLEVAVYNGTNWRVDEITVGLTIVKRGQPAARLAGAAKLVPAASQTTTMMEEKRPDVTTLYKMRAAAPPLTTTVFHTGLNVPLGPDEEWHWAIVQAKGIPPRPSSVLQGSQGSPFTPR
jgi:hypothetical protein